MEEIKLWRIGADGNNKQHAEEVSGVIETDTERLLEEVLMHSPNVLMKDLRVIGRQTETPGGPLDLLGIDGEGHLVVFELKKGTLTRDAVSQVIDYASYLASLQPDELNRHITDRSGQYGTEKFEHQDFATWYQTEYAKSVSDIGKPRMVLVGIGVDERARRMTSFLAIGEIDVSLITFHGFREDGKTFLARQVEVEAKLPEQSVGQSRVNNLDKMQRRLAQTGMTVFYGKLTDMFRRNMSQAYEWPNASGYSYYLMEQTEAGNPSNRAYLALYVLENHPHEVQVLLQARAVEAIGPGLDDLFAALAIHPKHKANGTVEIWLKPSVNLTECENAIKALCGRILEGWEKKREATTQ
jgi:hypothetical protein